MKNGHSKAYTRIHKREECVSETRSGAKVDIQTNSRPLDSMIHKESLRTERVYDWQKGTSSQKPLDVLTNAQRNIHQTRITPVTNGRRRNKTGDDSGSPSCCGSMSIPTIGGRY